MSTLTAPSRRFQLGDRVRVKDSLLFDGRVGEIIPTSGHPDDPWDHYVTLEAEELYGPQRIGVTIDQIEPLEDEATEPAEQL